MNGFPPTDGPDTLSVADHGATRPRRGNHEVARDGIPKSEERNARSEIHAVSVGLAQRAFGMDARIPGLSVENARTGFRAFAADECNACGRTEMLLAVGTKPVSACVR